jgi:S-(hydroxymethyl)glutathione dehydrogenase/alcohol dehydrogenase
MDKKIEIDSLVSRVVPLDKINEGFDAMHAGETIRTVVTF